MTDYDPRESVTELMRRLTDEMCARVSKVFDDAMKAVPGGTPCQSISTNSES